MRCSEVWECCVMTYRRGEMPFKEKFSLRPVHKVDLYWLLRCWYDRCHHGCMQRLEKYWHLPNTKELCL